MNSMLKLLNIAWSDYLEIYFLHATCKKPTIPQKLTLIITLTNISCACLVTMYSCYCSGATLKKYKSSSIVSSRTPHTCPFLRFHLSSDATAINMPPFLFLGTNTNESRSRGGIICQTSRLEGHARAFGCTSFFAHTCCFHN